MLYAIGSNLLLGALLLALMAWLLRPDGVRLDGGDEAAALFARLRPAQRPRAQATPAMLAADGRAALVVLEDDALLGFIERRGRRWNARVLAPGDLAALREEAGGVLRLEFTDFGWPAARVALADGAERERWMHRLRAFVAPADAREARDAG
jgi:hypothetical protein